MSAARRAAFAAVVIGGLLAAATASAQTGVRVEIGGRGGDAAESEVRSQIEAHAELTLSEDGPVRVTGQVRGARLTLTAEGPSGEIASATFRGRRPRQLRRDLEQRFWERIGAPIVAAGAAASAPRAEDAAPPTEAPVAAVAADDGDDGDDGRGGEDDAADDASESAPPSSVAAGAHPDALRASVTVGIYSRDFGYVDDIFLELRGYALPAAPMLRLGVTWHPLAHLSDEIWADLFGLRVDAQLPLGLETELGDEVYPTQSSEWSVGLRARLPIDAHAVGVTASYAERAFAIQRMRLDQPRVDVPDLHYHEVRLDADAWLDLEVVAFGVHGGWSFVVETGGIESVDWFRQNRSHGAGAGLEVMVPLAEGLNAALLFDWRGYFFDMRSQPGDPRVAGGALDHHLSASIGLSYRTR